MSEEAKDRNEGEKRDGGEVRTSALLDGLPAEFYSRVHGWLGDGGRRFFWHCLGLTGTVSPVLKMNKKRTGLPCHPVHFREGMQVRNYLRAQPECREWTDHDYDNAWAEVVTRAIQRKAV